MFDLLDNLFDALDKFLDDLDDTLEEIKIDISDKYTDRDHKHRRKSGLLCVRGNFCS